MILSFDPIGDRVSIRRIPAVQRVNPVSYTHLDVYKRQVQTWTLAYWPDGSIKWTGFAAVAGPASGALHAAPGSSAAPAQPVRVAEMPAALAIDTGKLQCRIPRSGPYFLDALTTVSYTHLKRGYADKWKREGRDYSVSVG